MGDQNKRVFRAKTAGRELLFVGAGKESDTVPGVIIEHSQGVTATGGGGEMPFEIHLPELVGPISLEADESTSCGGLRANALVSAKDRRDRARGWHVLPLEREQAGMEFSTFPCRVLVAQSQHFSLHVARGASGRAARSATLVAQARIAVCAKTCQPLVAGLATDVKSLT